MRSPDLSIPDPGGHICGLAETTLRISKRGSRPTHEFEPPEDIDASTIWRWRVEGLRIVLDANKSNIGVIASQTLQDRGVKGKEDFGLNSSAIAKAFESKIRKEQKLAEEVARKGLLT